MLNLYLYMVVWRPGDILSWDRTVLISQHHTLRRREHASAATARHWISRSQQGFACWTPVPAEQRIPAWQQELVAGFNAPSKPPRSAFFRQHARRLPLPTPRWATLEVAHHRHPLPCYDMQALPQRSRTRCAPTTLFLPLRRLLFGGFSPACLPLRLSTTIFHHHIATHTPVRTRTHAHGLAGHRCAQPLPGALMTLPSGCLAWPWTTSPQMPTHAWDSGLCHMAWRDNVTTMPGLLATVQHLPGVVVGGAPYPPPPPLAHLLYDREEV